MGFIMNKDKSLNEMMLNLFNKSTIVDLSSETISESKSLSGRIYQDPEHNGEFELDRVLTDIYAPQLIIFLPDKPNGTGILIIPGGGYQAVMLDKEGTALAPEFLSQGYTLFVLSYRLPSPAEEENINKTFIDAISAMLYIRKNADKWHLQRHRIGVLGFSAGGHIASTFVNQICDFKRSSDSKEQEIFAIPDFVGLIYPVISMKDDVTHPGSRKQLLGDNSTSENIIQYSADLNVTSCFPPVFLLHCCDDDLVSIENSLLMYRGLIEKGVSAEMHLYEKGGHGFSIQWATDLPVGGWIKLFMDWMYSHGFK